MGLWQLGQLVQIARLQGAAVHMQDALEGYR